MVKAIPQFPFNIVVFLAALTILNACASPTQDQTPGYSGPVEQITVGAGKSAVLVYIAQDQGFFLENGLEVEIIDFQAGKLAADALLAGDVDIATASRSVLVSQSFEISDLLTFGEIAHYQIRSLIARQDHGIEQISDLKGKIIGVTKRSGGEFALGKFFIFNDISVDEVEIVDLTPLEIVDALAAGEIDAALTWEPYVYDINQALGDKAISWPGDDQDSSFILLSMDEWISDHPSAVERFLQALRQAEDFVAENGDLAQQFMVQHFDFDPTFYAVLWPKYTHAVRLSQSLILAMEDEARWRIESQLTDKNAVPNFLDFIYLDALEALDPSAVTIIR